MIRFFRVCKGMGNGLKTSSFTKDFNEIGIRNMLQRLFKDRLLIVLVVLVVIIRIFSLNEAWVESCYTYGFYPVISKVLRFITGWIPFSIGDLLYVAAFIWLLTKVWKVIALARRKELKSYLSWQLFSKYLKLILLVYCIFNLFWGLNYYRQGIATQLGLDVKPYGKTELVELTCILQQQLNRYADQIDSIERDKLNNNRLLFNRADSVYRQTVNSYSFLSYPPPSQKPSMFSSIGHYFGFTGYYNPFTGEAQLKTTVPVFLKPFIICHEMGHQLGYAKENEANFISYLSCKSSTDVDFKYSVYFDLYRYALNNLVSIDPWQALAISKGVHQRVKTDMRTLRAYFQRTKNPVEPLMNKAYDQYLKMNNQPKGFQTYNEVVAWLIAYQKKFGSEAI
ncbi:MAG: DUF3810 domain-containing protein [Chitinophagaceae bacterium]